MMTYFQLVRNFRCRTKSRIFIIAGKQPQSRQDALDLIRRKLSRQFGKHLQITYSLKQKGDVDYILSESAFWLRVIKWEGGVLEELEIKRFLRKLEDLNGHTIIIDASCELVSIFKKVFTRQDCGVLIDCQKEPSNKEDFVHARLSNVSDIRLDDEAAAYLAEQPFLSLFNTFSILETLWQSKVTMKTLKKYRLLHGDLEVFLVERLISKGCQSILNYSFKNIDNFRFLRLLLQKLTILLVMKSAKSGRVYMKASELEIPVCYYYSYTKIAKKMSYEDLYRRLYLVISMFRWASYSGSLLLFLAYWR